jgi:glycosyltransferase involved in cell wall biosynthesis
VNTTTILAAALVGRPGGARLVWHIHEIVVSPLPLALVMRVVPALAATRVISVSEAVACHLVAPCRLRRRIAVIRNGIADRPQRAEAAADRQPLVVFVGRLNRWKGYEVLVEALADLNQRRPGTFRVAIAGSTPPGEEWRAADLQRRLEEASLAGCSEVLGQLDDPIPLLDRADIVVAPSTLPDPFPTVILEAMRSARAVVASDHGGAPEMLDHGSSGILVPPRDSEALAAAIERLIDDPGLRAALGGQARARFELEYREDRFLAAIGALHLEVSGKVAQ